MAEAINRRPDFRETIGRGGPILVDQDSVLADFEGALARILQEQHPEIPLVPYEKRTTFYIADDYAENHRDLVRAIHDTKRFIAELPPIPGALESLRQMVAEGYDVMICTSPLTRNVDSSSEKHEWVIRHLGDEWKRRLIITPDKTLVVGSILIDDKPEITGRMKPPTWEHIIFDAPYNRGITDKRRMMSWDDWRGIVNPQPPETTQGE